MKPVSFRVARMGPLSSSEVVLPARGHRGAHACSARTREGACALRAPASTCAFLATPPALLPPRLAIPTLDCRASEDDWGMDAEAEIVRSTLGWALRVIADDAAATTSTPGPRLSEFQLGRLVHRQDAITALDIARDLDVRDSQVYIEAARIVAEERATPRPSSRASSRQRADAVQHALRLVGRVHAHHRGEKRRLLEQGSRLKTWKALERHWPGREWWSLRDEYAMVARKFFANEKFFILETSNFILSMDRLREVRR